MKSVRAIASAIVDLDRFFGIGVGDTVGFGIARIALQGYRGQIGVPRLDNATLDALSYVPASGCKIRATPYKKLYDVPHIFLHSIPWPRHAGQVSEAHPSMGAGANEFSTRRTKAPPPIGGEGQARKATSH